MIRKDILANIADAFSDFQNQYQTILNIFYAFAIVTCVIVMVLNITKLSKAGDNPQERSEAMKGILISGVCIGILGSLGLVYAILAVLVLGP